MKAISIRQPYAFAIVHGFKPVENRDWRHSYCGPVLIHTGQKEESDQVTRVVAMIADQTGTSFGKVHALYKKHSARGSIVGRAVVVDCVTSHPSRWFSGPYAFVLKDAQWCEPQRFRGALSFFEVPDFVARTLNFQRLTEAASGDLFGGRG